MRIKANSSNHQEAITHNKNGTPIFNGTPTLETEASASRPVMIPTVPIPTVIDKCQ